ncbi:smoothelin-like protein 1 [Artibeus jamaicensis]|uniref:smoothelin-like protein 1 n=1 Tax=Artibeus jamaicensis TaxID=9417 RepID=UPI00235B0542|nr:smoothelin-like protein 1 [Artibeus jamaicensis]XP_053515104.1 smoothelin-like protein 1 [Artibeus jamaicensis]XP_053515105.1 smoothelin-like protein 1 [Artibeus jamaicensis]
MEHKEGKPSEDGNTVSPDAGTPGTPVGEASADMGAKVTEESIVTEGPPSASGRQGGAAAEDGISAELQEEASGSDEVKVESKVEAELPKEGGGKEETKEAPQETTDGKEETKSEHKEAKGKEKQRAEEKAAKPESGEKADREDEAKAELKQAGGAQEPTRATQEENQPEEPEAEAQAKASAPEAKSDSEEKAAPQERDRKEEADSGGPREEQDQGMDRELEEGAEVTPSSPEEWPESPTEEGQGLSPDGLGPDTTTSGETSPSASESSPSEVPSSPTEPPPSQEKKKEKAPERRVSAPARPRGVHAQNRKAIVDKFGGAASGPTALFRNTKAAGAAIGSVKNMLLEWCRAMTRNYEHVDIQNFSSSWSSGMAFCALIHKFFPDAFDYAELDPTKRRHNFTLAFSTAEKLADCAQLLEVEDMVRLAVPDSKCVYTYIQELYRSLVQKGLVKTKKK